jgi:hypothetical protein
MASLTEAFPNAKTLLALEPEELGDVILELIHEGISSNAGRFAISDILYAVNYRETVEWPVADRGHVTQAVAEALAWLEHAGPFALRNPVRIARLRNRTRRHCLRAAIR